LGPALKLSRKNNDLHIICCGNHSIYVCIREERGRVHTVSIIKELIDLPSCPCLYEKTTVIYEKFGQIMRSLQTAIDQTLASSRMLTTISYLGENTKNTLETPPVKQGKSTDKIEQRLPSKPVVFLRDFLQQ